MALDCNYFREKAAKHLSEIATQWRNLSRVREGVLRTQNIAFI
jgi:hypothetical protein